MADPLDVLTLAEAKEAANLTNTSEHDTELESLVTAISGRLDNLVGPIVQRDVTDFLNGGNCFVWVSAYPVETFTSVTEYSGTTATVLQPETNASKPGKGYFAVRYSNDPTLYGNKLVRRSSGQYAEFPHGLGNIEVVYSAGRALDTAEVPERYKRAASLALKNLWRSQEISPQQVSEFDVPQQNFPTVTIPQAAKDMLRNEIQQPRRFVA